MRWWPTITIPMSCLPVKKLLKHSLEQDGFTQPVVVSEEKEHYLVVDGFSSSVAGQESGYENV